MGGIHGPEPWMVRIRNAEGDVCGAGMLVAADMVLTCAHLLPPEPFVDFADVPEGSRIPAGVAFLKPSDDSWRGDIALLSLRIPQPDRVTATLRRFPVRQVKQLRAYGFPDHPEVGYWAVTALVGKAGPGGDWIQLENRTGTRVLKGYSGAGVLTDPPHHLVGMIVAAQPAENLAFMIPSDTIARYLPGVPWIVGEPAIPADFARQRPAGKPDAAARREFSEFVGGPSGVNVQVVAGAAGTAAVHEAVLASDSGDEIDLAVDCAGLSVGEIVRRIAERAGVSTADIAGFSAHIGGSAHTGDSAAGSSTAPPMTILLTRVDRAEDPAELLRAVVLPLSERDSNRIALTFDEEHSEAARLGRLIKERRSSRLSARSEAERAAGLARVAEISALKWHRWASAVISGLPKPHRRKLHLRADAERAEKESRAAVKRYRRLLDAHKELRGRLTSYQALGAQYGQAEKPELTALYERAYALLHDGPAELAESEAAVDEFAAAVRRVRP